MKQLAGILFVVALALGAMAAPALAAPPPGPSIAADINPSAIGQSVTYTATGLKRGDYRVAFVKAVAGTVEAITVTSSGGGAGFSHAYAETGIFSVQIQDHRGVLLVSMLQTVN